jgi:hypothetical protein
MRSKFIISSLVAFIAAVGLMAAPAMADWSLAGYTSVAFGSLSSDSGVEDEDATSELATDARTELNLNASDGEFSSRFRIRFEDNVQAESPGTMRQQVTWKASDTVAVTIAGSHFGFAGAGVNTNFTPFRGKVGDLAVDGQFDQYSVPAAKVDIGLGGLNVGVGIVTQCGRLCGGDSLDAGDQTVVAHVSGSAGSISYNFAFGTGSGTAQGDVDEDTGEAAYVDESVGGTGMQLGLTFDGGAFSVGFDYGSQTVGGIGDADDRVKGFTGLGVKFGDIGVVYHGTTDDAAGAGDGITGTEIGAVYSWKVGEKSLMGVDFRSLSESDGRGDETVDSSDTWIALGMRLNF